MNVKTILLAGCTFLAVTAICSSGNESELAELGRILRYDFAPDDFFPPGQVEPDPVPFRFLDGFQDWQSFMARHHWTTNQMIEGLVYCVTNSLAEGNFDVAGNQEIAGTALWKLNQIDHPAVTNFFRMINDNPLRGFAPAGVIGMFIHTNLEPEVLDYMRTLCVRTNIYAGVETCVMRDMFETLETMPDHLKPAATNRVARYMYYAIRHTTRQMTYQDRCLAGFISAYSNSLQRLDAMYYVESSTTNARQRVRARMEIERLTSLPEGNLNDIPWISE